MTKTMPFWFGLKTQIKKRTRLTEYILPQPKLVLLTFVQRAERMVEVSRVQRERMVAKPLPKLLTESAQFKSHFMLR